MNRRGFTLVELLVGMALMGIVMTVLISFFSQGSRASTQSGSRAELQHEALTAQQLISSKLKEAWYIYPPRASSSDFWQLTATSLTKNPVNSTNLWYTSASVTPNQPLLAMILPPEVGTTAYRFLAYYPVKRSEWVAGTADTSWRNPGPDNLNADTWVLAEYRAAMPSTFAPSSFPPATPPDMPTGSQANLLSDYVAPTIVTPGLTTSANTYTMFTYTTRTWPGSSTAYVDSVTFNLATTRSSGGTTLRLPGQTGTYTVTVSPTNLGKFAAN